MNCLNISIYLLLFGSCSLHIFGAPQRPDSQTFNGVGVEFVPLEATEKPSNTKTVEDAKYWHKVGLNQLKKTIKLAEKTKESSYKRKAKNVIIFIGDGMGVTTITAGRIFKGQYLKKNNGEEEMLAFDNFPYTGLAKTYNVDKQVPDSAGTATAIFCGVKTDYGAIGVDTTRTKSDPKRGRLTSIMDWAQAIGKRTGIVTTTRITHATPAATYANIYDRDYECDTKVPTEFADIQVDIARQLVEQAPGKNFNVILGGGLQPMGATNENETKKIHFDGSTEKPCKRGDGRNMVEDWLKLSNINESRIFVNTRKEMLDIDTKKVDHLMGLFRNNHITYSIAREEGEPSLKEMVETAIKVLDRGNKSKGYVLLVEGGRIDQAHHQNYARAAMREVFELDMAVEAALNMTDDSETLILVTADHSHAVTLNGYPKRGTDILGFAQKPEENTVYETLTYANGPGYWDHLDNRTEGTTKLWLPMETFTHEERESPLYRHSATIPIDDETHGGEDVAVFANGPGASLVRGVFEQNYLAYVMSYAGCFGPAQNFDDSCRRNNSAAMQQSILILLFTSLISWFFVHN